MARSIFVCIMPLHCLDCGFGIIMNPIFKALFTPLTPRNAERISGTMRDGKIIQEATVTEITSEEKIVETCKAMSLTKLIQATHQASMVFPAKSVEIMSGVLEERLDKLDHDQLVAVYLKAHLLTSGGGGDECGCFVLRT
jgi:hypothetical protein